MPLHRELDFASGALRKRIFEVVEGDHQDNSHARAFDIFIVALIVLNIAAFVAETVPSIDAQYGRWLEAFEVVSVLIFTAEYALRVWTAVEMPFLSRLPPTQARFKFARRPAQLIDLAAILPFYLSFLVPVDLRVLRILRLARFFKLGRYSPALHTLGRVLYNERRSLSGAGLLLLGAVLFASTGIYYIEGTTQPDKFGSVPEAAYWAITTLTTVGYGDVTPITALGKLWAGIVMVAGLCILALPVAIIATGFSQEVGRRDFVVTWSLMSRIPILAELEASQVAEVMPLLHANNLPPKIEVICEGSPGNAIYFVASGNVTRHDPHGDERYASGEMFGTVATLNNDLHTASYVTTTRTRLLKLHREDIHRLSVSNPAIGTYIRNLAATRSASRSARALEPAFDSGDATQP